MCMNESSKCVWTCCVVSLNMVTHSKQSKTDVNGHFQSVLTYSALFLCLTGVCSCMHRGESFGAAQASPTMIPTFSPPFRQAVYKSREHTCLNPHTSIHIITPFCRPPQFYYRSLVRDLEICGRDNKRCENLCVC